jgi:hypothetical protein
VLVLLHGLDAHIESVKGIYDARKSMQIFGRAQRVLFATTFKISSKQLIILAVHMRLVWGVSERCTMGSLMEKRLLSNVHMCLPFKPVQVFVMRSCFSVGFITGTLCICWGFVKIKESRYLNFPTFLIIIYSLS